MRRYKCLSFHRLPLIRGDSETLKLWLLVLQLDLDTSLDTLRVKDYRVCSEHFDEEDFSQSSGKHRYLKRNAVPKAKRPGDNVEVIVAYSYRRILAKTLQILTFTTWTFYTGYHAFRASIT